MVKILSDMVRIIKNGFLLLWKKFTINYRNVEEEGFGVQGIDMFY